jgi:regulatory protein
VRRGGGEAPAERSTDVAKCREAALALLEHSRRTRAELARRLRDRQYDAATIDAVIERLVAVGLVDDTEYARAWLAGRRNRRPAGRRRLEQELRGKGLSAEAIEQGAARLDEERGPADEVAGARRVIAQAERRYQSLEPRVRAQRLYALLARRGFDADVIRRALNARDALESGEE